MLDYLYLRRIIYIPGNNLSYSYNLPIFDLLDKKGKWIRGYLYFPIVDKNHMRELPAVVLVVSLVKRHKRNTQPQAIPRIESIGNISCNNFSKPYGIYS